MTQPHPSQSTPAHDPNHGAKVIKRAVEIMAQGHYGWSWALAKAQEELGQKEAR